MKRMREKAERLVNKKPIILSDEKPETFQATLHELQVHQI
jgi:hypothetical protein